MKFSLIHRYKKNIWTFIILVDKRTQKTSKNRKKQKRKEKNNKINKWKTLLQRKLINNSEVQFHGKPNVSLRWNFEWHKVKTGNGGNIPRFHGGKWGIINLGIDRAGRARDLSTGAHQREILFHVKITRPRFQIMDNLAEFTFMS